MKIFARIHFGSCAPRDPSFDRASRCVAPVGHRVFTASYMVNQAFQPLRPIPSASTMSRPNSEGHPQDFDFVPDGLEAYPGGGVRLAGEPFGHSVGNRQGKLFPCRGLRIG